MKLSTLCSSVLVVLCPFFTTAQQNNCINKKEVIKIDFGTAEKPQLYNLSALNKYEVINDRCPDDGHMSFASSTSTCFWGNWYPLKEDHSPGDVNGKMLLVNASYDPGTFFITNLAGLKPKTRYEFSVWLINICVGSNGCEPASPFLEISLSAAGKKIVKISTGYLPNEINPQWQKHTAWFETGADAGLIELRIDDLAPGGCGNDFAMDDLSIAECSLPEPEKPAITVEKPVVKTETPKAAIKVPEPAAPVLTAKKVTPVKKQEAAKSPGIKISTKEKTNQVNIDPVLTTRKNELAKEIITEAKELTVNLYDNGEIDGDTVSIYHNQQLLISRAGLSAKPVSFTIKLNDNEPNHEITMVAENLGSIPPNTSLMVITGAKERYEVFISSSKQKNASVLIRQRKK